MSNDSTPVGGAREFDSDALEQWVAETASQKGVSKQRLLDEILSSYWVLEELSEVVSESSTSDDPEQSAEPVDTHGPQQSRDDQPTDADEASTGVEFSDLKRELQEIRSAVDELSADETADADERSDAAESELADLEGQLADFSSAVADHRSETASTVAELSEQLDAVDKRLESVESQLDAGMSPAELREAVEETNSAHTELEERIESEFDSIEQVLQHLLDTTDNIEYRLGAVSDSRKEALRPLQQRNAMRDKLADLKQEAIRHGVRECRCDHCGTSIDLGMLERPECPSCGRRATGIAESGWLSLSKATLKTAAPNQSTRAADPDTSWQPTDAATDDTQTQSDW